MALNGHLDFGFAFGAASFQAHLLAGDGQARVVETPGLGFGIDTPGDFELAVNPPVMLAQASIHEFLQAIALRKS